MGELNSIKPRLSPQEVPQFSQYAARSLNAMALQCGSTPQDLIERFEKQPVTRDSMRSRLEKIDDPEMLDIVMRQLRREVMTALIVRDLSARADFQEVVSTVTAWLRKPFQLPCGCILENLRSASVFRWGCPEPPRICWLSEWAN